MNEDTQLIWEAYGNIDEVAMANTEYSRSHNSAKLLTKKANLSMKLDHIVDAIKAHIEALNFTTSITNKAAHRGHIKDLSKKIIMSVNNDQQREEDTSNLGGFDF